MAYKKGMPRYMKKGGNFVPNKEGDYYKASDGKMYRMTKEDMSSEGMEAESESGEAGEEKEGGPSCPRAKKSEITEDDFQKSLDKLEELAKADDPQSRKEELLQKAMTEDLTPEEAAELYKSMGGEVQSETPVETVSEELTKSFKESEPIQKALDVSDYLDAQHTALVKSLDAIGEIIEGDRQRQHEYNIVLAKALHQMGGLVKGMSERLGIIEVQPARAPKSRGVGQPAHSHAIQKSFSDGNGPQEPEMSKSEILDTMEAMMKSLNPDSSEASRLLNETAKYESANQISKAMLNEVMAFRKSHAH